MRQAAALAGLPFPAAAAAADRLAAVEVLLAREPLAIRASAGASRDRGRCSRLGASQPPPRRGAPALRGGRERGTRGRPSAARPCRGQRLGRRTPPRRRPRGPAPRRRPVGLPVPPARAGGAAAARSLRAGVLAELGAAEAALGSASAAEHLAAAADGYQRSAPAGAAALSRVRRCTGRGSRAGRGGLRNGLGRARPGSGGAEATDCTTRCRPATSPPRRCAPSCERVPSSARPSCWRRAERGPRSQGQRMLLAQAALQIRVRRRARRAHGESGGARLGRRRAARAGARGGHGVEAGDGSAQPVPVSSSAPLELTDAVLEDARQRHSPVGLRDGQILPRAAEAVAGAGDGCDRRTRGCARFDALRLAQFSPHGRAAGLALCLIETRRASDAGRGADPGASERSMRTEISRTPSASAREPSFAWPREGRRRPARCTRARGALGAEIRVLGSPPWRTVAALASLALGEREQRARVRARGAARRGAMRCAPRPHQGGEGQWAVRGRSPGSRAAGARGRARLRGAPRLETVRALVDLGAALRRANQRAAEPRAAPAGGRPGAQRAAPRSCSSVR